MQKSGCLSCLSLAWSRDRDEEFYFHDRMRKVGPELWRWLTEGAHVYICGDAKRMVKDVERGLVDISAEYGAHSTEEAVNLVTVLKRAGRYWADVY